MEGADSTEVIVSEVKRKIPVPAWRWFIPSLTTTLLIGFFIVSLLINTKTITKRGFFCYDSSINYPYKPQTIGINMLIFTSFVVPGITIKICDIILNRLLKNLPRQGKLISSKRRKMSDHIKDVDIEEEHILLANPEEKKRRKLIINEDDSEYEVMNSELNHIDQQDDCEEGDINLFTHVSLDSDNRYNISAKREPYITNKISPKIVGEFQLFFFGINITLLLTGIGKITCGRFRPHFIQLCKPDVDCSKSENANRYIEEFTCTNDQLRYRDMSYITTSWPSGHASIIFYSMLYMVIYLNTVIPIIMLLSSKKMKCRFNPLILYTIYVMMIGLAGFISLTRVSDYHHHPLDVFSGSIIGSVIAITLSNSFRRQYPLRVSVC